jgi:integrase
MFHLATEWGKVTRVLPRVRLLAGENHRERILSFEEEKLYLDAALVIGHEIEDAYQQVLEGIRAVLRGQQPKRADSYLLRDVATILIDCALRPEECFRLKWENFRDGRIDIHKGKGKGSRRRIPASQRAQGSWKCERAIGFGLDFPDTDSQRPHGGFEHQEATRCGDRGVGIV